DLDIHVKLHDDESFFTNQEDAFFESIEISRKYEEQFCSQNRDYLHVPRTQIVNLNQLENEAFFVYPRIKDVEILIGKPKQNPIQSDSEIRTIDKNNILELKTHLLTLPMSAIDRSGLDLWTLVRRMSWRISPTPVRLLTQFYDSPLDVWTFNRTKICEELEKKEFSYICKLYTSYYETGWKAFFEGFKVSNTLRELLILGYKVLKSCLKEIEKEFPRENEEDINTSRES
ncbi:MAG: hypothetical protein KAS95_03360, partial [Candidatus Heimdallarchaeota archaeon]|nr:hypothetical protein [Candidatus Heimdallarchaeota archaeon]